MLTYLSWCLCLFIGVIQCMSLAVGTASYLFVGQCGTTIPYILQTTCKDGGMGALCRIVDALNSLHTVLTSLNLVSNETKMAFMAPCHAGSLFGVYADEPTGPLS